MNIIYYVYLCMSVGLYLQCCSIRSYLYQTAGGLLVQRHSFPYSVEKGMLQTILFAIFSLLHFASEFEYVAVTQRQQEYRSRPSISLIMTAIIIWDQRLREYMGFVMYFESKYTYSHGNEMVYGYMDLTNV